MPPRQPTKPLAYPVPTCEELSLEEPGKFPKTLFPHFNVTIIHPGFCYKADLDLVELGGVQDAAFLTSLQVMLVAGYTVESEEVQKVWEKWIVKGFVGYAG